eukprot:891713-Heterocapsa_arctica.AAC.1
MSTGKWDELMPGTYLRLRYLVVSMCVYAHTPLASGRRLSRIERKESIYVYVPLTNLPTGRATTRNLAVKGSLDKNAFEKQRDDKTVKHELKRY